MVIVSRDDNFGRNGRDVDSDNGRRNGTDGNTGRIMKKWRC